MAKWGIGALVVLLGTSGCLSPVHIRSARTLAPGEYEVAGDVSAAFPQLGAVDWYTGTPDPMKKPATSTHFINPLEIAARRGIVDNVDVGVRLGFGSALVGAEGTWRFLQHSLGELGNLHLATGIQVGQALVDQIKGGRAALPVMFTWDWAPFSATLAGHLGYRWESVKDKLEPTSAPTAISDLRWTMGTTGFTGGGGLMFDWHDETTTIGLAFEVDRWTGEIGAAGKPLSSYGVTTFQVALVGGYRFGKDDAEMEKTKDAIDALGK